MDNNNIFSELFELRIGLMDDYIDEAVIIRELKYYLHDTGMGINYINSTLLDFYEHFGINISPELINSVQINTNSFGGNFNFLFNHQSNDNNIEEKEDDIQAGEIPMPNLNYSYSFSSSSNPLLNNSLLNLIYQPLINPHPYLNGLNMQPVNVPVNNILPEIDIPNHNSMINIINMMLSGINANPPPMENVRVTTDEADLKELKTTTLTETIEGDCTICMGNMVKDEIVMELGCKHNFHKDCIETYLKEYNYKCPVCRQEVGKAKYDI